jgi:hypothetical protein
MLYGRSRRLWVFVAILLLAAVGPAVRAQPLSQDLLYTSLQPCRLVDTRAAGGPIQPGSAGARTFNVVGVSAPDSLASQGGSPNGCPVPGFADVPQVQAVLLNVVAVTPSGPGDLRAWPTDQPIPMASILNFPQGLTIANAVVLPVRQDHPGGDITVQADVSATQVVADVLGYFSGFTPNAISGADNLFLGTFSSNAGTTTGANNTGIGTFSLRSITSGAFNTAVGTSALTQNSTGSFDTAVGAFALQSHTSGGTNTAVGAFSLGNVTTGQANTAIGDFSSNSNQTGMDNTAVGTAALHNSLSGSSNIAIGFNAGTALNGGESNDIYVGNAGTAGESGVIRIGSVGQHFAAFIAGINGVASSGGTQVFVNGSGQLGTTTSSVRFKQDVRDMGSASEGLMRLRPVTFHYRPEFDDGSRLLQYGLLAEEVARVYPDLVQYDPDGRPFAVRYHFVNAMLLNEVQKQHASLEDQKARLEEQAAEIAAQRRRIEDLEAHLARLETSTPDRR